jgi:hypothetical protein
LFLLFQSFDSRPPHVQQHPASNRIHRKACP